MPNISSFGAQTDNAVVQGTVTDRQMVIPDVPPQGLMSVGPRVTPNFVKPREWSAQTTYHFFDAVKDGKGNAYVATKPVVPAGTPLADEDYWFLWADPDTRFDDLNEIVKTYNQRITKNANDITTLNRDLDTERQTRISEDAKKEDITRLRYKNIEDYGVDVTNTKEINDFIKNNDYIYLPGSITLTEPLVIRADKHVKFDTLIADDFDGYAINLTSGWYGRIEGNSIISYTNCGGVAFVNENDPSHEEFSTVQGTFITIDRINVKKPCIAFLNGTGVLDLTFTGSVYENTGSNVGADNFCIDLTRQRAYVGQMTFRINRLVSSKSFAIACNSKNVLLTGMDFGYCSLEGSESGILIELSNTQDKTFEQLIGNFRVNEMNTKNKKLLKITGNALSVIGNIDIKLDYYNINNIDVSEMVNSSSLYYMSKIKLTGYSFNNEGKELASSYWITNQRIIANDNYKEHITIASDAEGLSWMKTQSIPNVIEASNEFVMPTCWDGRIIKINSNTENITIKYKKLDGTYTELKKTWSKPILIGYSVEGTGNVELYTLD